MDDFGIDTNLSEFFSAVKVEKIKKKKELDKLVSNSFEDFFIRPLEEELSHKKNKKHKNIDESTLATDPENLIEKTLGLLAEPSETTVQKDPLTPLDQKFATLDDLQNHYKLFLARIQQQLSTLGGGGETRLKYLDDIVGIATNPSVYDQKFLQYNHSIKKFEFIDPNDSSGSTIISISGITTYYQASNIDDYIGINADVPVNIILPQSPTQGKKITIKDEGNKINTYNVTVQAGIGKSVENDNSVIMSINHQSLTFFYNGINWYII